MKIELILFCSPLHDSKALMTSREHTLQALSRHGTLKIIEAGDYVPGSGADVLPICYIASGGSEEIFISLSDRLKGEIVLLCDSFSNSLAASLEISTWLKNQGRSHRLINIPEEEILADRAVDSIFSPVGTEATCSHTSAASVYGQPQVRELLGKTVIGCIGGESSWLISSHIDKPYIQDTFGTRFIDIGIQELIDRYRRTEEDDIRSYPLYTRIDKESGIDLRSALKMTFAIEALVRKYGLTALTIKCFDLLDPTGTTSCLALSLLNDSGIIAGCEGDLPSLWTMIIGSCLYQKPMFMSNPSSTDPRNRTIDFAHCTVPTRLLKDYRFMTHFESGIGVAIKGEMPLGRCMLIKIGGKRLDSIYQAEGEIIKNTDYIYRCRTQVRFRFSRAEDFEAFFSKGLSNHTIIAPID